MKRLLFVDLARSIAIALALMSHYFSLVDAYDGMGRTSEVIVRTLFHTGAPSFIFLFGVMLGLIYLPAMETKGKVFVRNRLLVRAFQCYLLYILMVGLRFLLGKQPVQEALLAAVFFWQCQGNNVFKFYAIAMIAAVGLLFLMKEKGPVSMVWIAGLVWLIDPLLRVLNWPVPGTSGAYFTGILFGMPAKVSNLSVYHSLTFIALGIMMGNILRQSRVNRSFRDFQKAGFLLFSACALIVIVLMIQESSAFRFFNGYAKSYREQHLAAYYAFGLLESLCLLFSLAWLCKPETSYSDRWIPLLHFGRSTMLSFTVGNIILLFIPRHLGLSPWAAGVSGLFYLAATLGLVHGYLKMKAGIRDFWSRKSFQVKPAANLDAVNANE